MAHRLNKTPSPADLGPAIKLFQDRNGSLIPGFASSIRAGTLWQHTSRDYVSTENFRVLTAGCIYRSQHGSSLFSVPGDLCSTGYITGSCTPREEICTITAARTFTLSDEALLDISACDRLQFFKNLLRKSEALRAAYAQVSGACDASQDRLLRVLKSISPFFHDKPIDIRRDWLMSWTRCRTSKTLDGWLNKLEKSGAIQQLCSDHHCDIKIIMLD